MSHRKISVNTLSYISSGNFCCSGKRRRKKVTKINKFTSLGNASHGGLNRQKHAFELYKTTAPPPLSFSVCIYACVHSPCQNNNLFCCWDPYRDEGTQGERFGEGRCETMFPSRKQGNWRCLSINRKSTKHLISWYDKWRTMLYILKGCAFYLWCREKKVFCFGSGVHVRLAMFVDATKTIQFWSQSTAW